MLLKICYNCEYYEKKLDSSYCAREGCFSFLSKCIQNKALDMFIRTNAIKDLDSPEDSRTKDMI